MNWTINTRDKALAILEAEVYIDGVLINTTTNGVLLVNAALGSEFELKIIPVDPTYRTYIQLFNFSNDTQALQPITVLFTTLTDESPVSNFYVYRVPCSSKINVYHASACLYTEISWKFGTNKTAKGYIASYSYQAYGQMIIQQTVKTCDVDLTVEDSKCQGVENLPSNAVAFQVRLDALGIGTPAVLKFLAIGNTCSTGGLTTFNLALNPGLGINDINDLADYMVTTYNTANPGTFAVATVDGNVVTFYVAKPGGRGTGFSSICLYYITKIPVICSESGANAATIVKNWTCNDCGEAGDAIITPTCDSNIPVYDDGISGEGALAGTFTNGVASETAEILVMIGTEVNCCTGLYQEEPTLGLGESATFGMNEGPEISVVITRHLDGDFYAKIVYDGTPVVYTSFSAGVDFQGYKTCPHVSGDFITTIEITMNP